jgi:hypothetical protein
MTELEPEVRELLDRWPASPAMPVSELTAQAVREEGGGFVDGRDDSSTSAVRARLRSTKRVLSAKAP